MRDSVSYGTRMAPKEEPPPPLTAVCFDCDAHAPLCVYAHRQGKKKKGKTVRLVGKTPTVNTLKTLWRALERMNFYVNYSSIKLLPKVLSNAIFCLSGCKPATHQSLSAPEGRDTDSRVVPHSVTGLIH